MLKPTGHIHRLAAPYTANPVMQIIDAHKDDLVKVGHSGAAICDLVMDVFLLGMIYGKRAERKKHRGKGRV